MFYELWNSVDIYFWSRVMGFELNREIAVPFFDSDIFSRQNFRKVYNATLQAKYVSNNNNSNNNSICIVP